MNFVFMKSPDGDEIKKVEATTAKLKPLMATGWHQVPDPDEHQAEPAPQEKK